MNNLKNSIQNINSTNIIEFPFRLRSEVAEYIIDKNLVIRLMDEESKSRLLKIKDADYNEDGQLIRFTPLSESLLLAPNRYDINLYAAFCSSNYVLISPSIELAKEFNSALKLITNSCASLFLGFENTGKTYFLKPASKCQNDEMFFSQSHFESLSSTVSKIQAARKDSKFQTMIEIYESAFSTQRRKESMFIEITVILEMLLLPVPSGELSYRFSLRLAKLLNKLSGEPSAETFKIAREIYTVRSKLVHKGSHTDFRIVFNKACIYVRLFLLAYLEDKDIFEESNLDEICLS